MVENLYQSRVINENNHNKFQFWLESVMDLKKETNDIPKVFINEFIGYRRSSNLGHVIRFHINTFFDKDTKRLGFINEYYRDNERWMVQGFGVFIKETMYFCGHARNNQTDDTLGLRFMALRQLGTRPYLVGLILSMDTDTQPIAARILLVPEDDHSFGEEYSGLSEPDRINRLLERGLDQDVLGKEIQSSLGGVFHPHSTDYLYRIIRNTSYTVLKLEIPEKPDFEMEQELITYALNNEQKVEPLVWSFANQWLDQLQRH